MHLLLLDNYDSFTYNLFQAVARYSHVRVSIKLNDQFDPDALENYEAVLLSPGPGLPENAGCMPALIQKADCLNMPVLGICLGMQAIYNFYGGQLRNLSFPLHGTQTHTELQTAHPLFKGLGEHILTGHYHSWVADESTLPDELMVIARNREGHIMGIQHRSKNICGLQFHPESVLTPMGQHILDNWITQLGEVYPA